MKILGVDYGKSKVGLAISDGSLPFPFKVIRFEDEKVLLEEILNIVRQEDIQKVILGVSEGKMRRCTLDFAVRLGKKLGDIPLVFQDETLTTREAQHLSIEAGIRRKKRHSLEDAYAAALILENYLGSSGR